MKDKELADKVVALGLGVKMETIAGPIYGRDVPEFDADYFVRDWRVAGALMGRCRSVNTYKPEFDSYWFVQVGGNFDSAESDSLPRAIIEACVTALEST